MIMVAYLVDAPKADVHFLWNTHVEILGRMGAKNLALIER